MPKHNLLPWTPLILSPITQQLLQLLILLQLLYSPTNPLPAPTCTNSNRANSVCEHNCHTSFRLSVHRPVFLNSFAADQKLSRLWTMIVPGCCAALASSPSWCSDGLLHLCVCVPHLCVPEQQFYCSVSDGQSSGWWKVPAEQGSVSFNRFPTHRVIYINIHI